MLTTIRQTTRSKLLSGFGLVLGLITLCSPATFAQQRYYPLDQSAPLGQYGAWAGFQHPTLPTHLQPVRIELPSHGRVTFFSEARRPSLTFNTAERPAQAAISLGGVYRLQISDLVDEPGLSLYPTIELVDVLHPPRGREDEFPIPVTLSAEDIALAKEGRLVTKVVYLEPGREANPLTASQAQPSITIPSQLNVVEEADRRGRPMLILRIGGRVPMPDEEPEFFGRGAPLSEFANPRVQAGVVK